MLIKGCEYGSLVAGERLLAFSSFDGDWYGPGLPWRDIAHITETADTGAPGVHDADCRLLLPLLADELPPEAPARVAAALTAVGAPDDSAQDTAVHLLGNRRPAARRPHGANSPLSGGSCGHTEPGSDAWAVLWTPGLTRPHSDALAEALGSRPVPS